MLTDVCVSGKLEYGCVPLIVKLPFGPAVLLWKSTLKIVDNSPGIGCSFTTICSV